MENILTAISKQLLKGQSENKKAKQNRTEDEYSVCDSWRFTCQTCAVQVHERHTAWCVNAFSAVMLNLDALNANGGWLQSVSRDEMQAKPEHLLQDHWLKRKQADWNGNRRHRLSTEGCRPSLTDPCSAMGLRYCVIWYPACSRGAKNDDE